MSKTIKKHPSVLECDTAVGTIPVEEGGPRYDVLLKEGWVFTGKYKGQGRRTAFFRTVREFLDSEPEEE